MTNHEMVMADIEPSTHVNSHSRLQAGMADFLYIDASDEPNSQEQELHADEDGLCGKPASDIPAFMAQDLDVLCVCSHICQFLTNGTSPKNTKLRNIITKATKHYFLHDEKLYKKLHGIICEICDLFKLH